MQLKITRKILTLLLATATLRLNEWLQKFSVVVHTELRKKSLRRLLRRRKKRTKRKMWQMSTTHWIGKTVRLTEAQCFYFFTDCPLWLTIARSVSSLSLASLTSFTLFRKAIFTISHCLRRSFAVCERMPSISDFSAKELFRCLSAFSTFMFEKCTQSSGLTKLKEIQNKRSPTDSNRPFLTSWSCNYATKSRTNQYF